VEAAAALHEDQKSGHINGLECVCLARRRMAWMDDAVILGKLQGNLTF